MRPPILFVTLGFGVGLWMGLGSAALPGAAFPSKAFSGGALWGVALPVLLASLLVARRAPLGAAIGLTGVAGLLWG
ncbi:MAG: hypothetical protein DMD67_01750, partial [Gemmatimonadetes bacterium]